MVQYISAKEFRQKFSAIAEDLKKSGEIVVLKRSKPLFRVIPFEEEPLDLLERASTVPDSGQMDLREISQVVHELRGVK